MTTPEIDERALEAHRAIDALCIEHRFFAYRLAVPGAQLGSTPFFCVGVVPGRASAYFTFYFCLDPELNVFRPDPEVLEVARACVHHAVVSVPGLSLAEHRIELVHVGIPPVDPASLPRPPAVPPVRVPPPVTPAEAAAIAAAFFRDHLELHAFFAEEIRAEVPWLKVRIPVDVEHVLWVPAEGNLVVYIRLDSEDLDPWRPPAVVLRLFDEALARMRRRHPELARVPVRLFYQK